LLIGVDASRAISPQRTGTENYSFHLIRGLLAIDGRNSYRLYFNRPPPLGLLEGCPGVEKKAIPFPRLWTHLRLSIEMAQYPPDVLFIPAHVLPLVHPPRSVVTIHDLGYLYYPQAHPLLERLYLDLSTRFSSRLAAHLIAASHATKADLVAKYGVADSKISVIHLGLGEEFRVTTEREPLERVREKYGLQGEYLLYVGRIHPRKNLSRLLEAFRLFRERMPGYMLVIAGRGSQQALGEAAHMENMRLLGYVEQGDLPALLSGARAFILPSLYEGFGLPMVEAMACGTPVAASDIPALREVGAEAVLFFDPHNVQDMAQAMERIASDETLRQELVARGLERARGFSWARCAQETLAVLERVGGPYV